MIFLSLLPFRPTRRLPFVPAALLGVLVLSSCGNQNPFRPKTAPRPSPVAQKPVKAEFVNPFPEGTYEHFRAEPNYKSTYAIFRNQVLLANTTPRNSSLVLDLSDQRAQLINGDAGMVAMDYPIASGKKGYETPTGSYTILEKLKDKKSNLYGKIYDAAGEVVNADATAGVTPVPPGGKFVGASMPYWMRLTWTGIGHHIGNVPRYPASHGCVRGYRKAVPTVFEKVKVGTPVTIQP